MACHRRRGPNVDSPPARERDLHEVEVTDLRRQLQQLQQRLEHYEPFGSHHDSDGESSHHENENPFYRERSKASSAEHVHHHRQRNRRNHEVQRVQLDVRVDIPEFEGRMQPDKFLDWLHSVERIFDFKELPEERNVKLVALK